MCYLLEEHSDAPWKYVILPNRSSGNRSQLCGVMWNTTRLALDDNIRALDVSHSVNGFSLWDRKPHLLSFKSSITAWRRNEAGEWERVTENRGLSIVPLHMKSNYGGVTQNRQVRAKEAETLCNALQAIDGTFDPSLIMLGDTNILRNDERLSRRL